MREYVYPIIAWIAADIFLLATYYITMKKYGGERSYSIRTLLAKKEKAA